MYSSFFSFVLLALLGSCLSQNHLMEIIDILADITTSLTGYQSYFRHLVT